MNTLLIITILILAVVLLALAWVLLFNHPDSGWRSTVKKKLSSLTQRSKSKNIHQLKFVLIDADKLLDFALRESKVRGNTLGERLKNSKRFFTSKQYNDVWEAHKVRNRLVHEIEARIDSKTINKSYRSLKQGIEAVVKR